MIKSETLPGLNLRIDDEQEFFLIEQGVRIPCDKISFKIFGNFSTFDINW
jgi:hypothetical protein